MRTQAPAGTSTPPRAALPLLAVAVTLVLWASAFVAIRYLVEDFSPGALSLGRLLVGSAVLTLLALRPGAPRMVRPTRVEWVRLVAIGLLWFAFYNIALNAGERLVDAGTAAMLIQVSPIVVAVLAAMFLGERFTVWLGVGLAVAFSGVSLIASAAGQQTHADPIGVGLVLAAAVAYGVAAIVQKPLMSRLSSLQVVLTACTVGAVACLPWAGELVRQTLASQPSDVAWVVYLGVFPTAIAFTTYGFALRHMRASSLAVTTFLVPPITIVLGWLLLDEVPPALAFVGGALCIVGVLIARRRPRRPSSAPPGQRAT
ncbi:DMT family transporter [Nocardioides rotundus]|nr:DMT family transporter [Nocardioides rotundus]